MPLSPIDPQHLTPAQAKVYRTIANSRGGVRGPFTIMLHSPVLAERLQQVGHYLRYESRLPGRARELAVMMVARHYRCLAEWNSHLEIALRNGVPATLLEAIATGREPSFESHEDAVVYEFVRETIAGEELADAVLEPARTLFGNEGIVDLNCVVGYYTLLALLMISFGVPATGGPAPWDIGRE